MKTALLIFSILCSLSAFAADVTIDQLVGHWQNTNDVKKIISDMTFKRDVTFSGKLTQEGKVRWEFEGKWTLKDHTVNYDYTVSSSARIPVGTKDQDTIVEMTKEYFVYQNIATPQVKKKWFKIE